MCIYIAVNSSKWNSSLWRSHVEHWLSLNSSVLVVKYENLFTNLYAELKRIMQFIKFPYTEDDLNCTINSFATKHLYKRYFRNYTFEQKTLINKEIRFANRILQKYAISYKEV